MSKLFNFVPTSTMIFTRLFQSVFKNSKICITSVNLHTKQPDCAVKKTTTAAGGVLGLGKGKKKVGKLGSMEKKQLPVETDPEKLVNYVCGSNIYINGEDVKIKDDSEYPEWLWTLHTGKPPRIEDLDPNTKQYWIRVRAEGMRRNNRLRSMRKF